VTWSCRPDQARPGKSISTRGAGPADQVVPDRECWPARGDLVRPARSSQIGNVGQRAVTWSCRPDQARPGKSISARGAGPADQVVPDRECWPARGDLVRPARSSQIGNVGQRAGSWSCRPDQARPGKSISARGAGPAGQIKPGRESRSARGELVLPTRSCQIGNVGQRAVTWSGRPDQARSGMLARAR
jgi:hypothetical protein